MKKSLLLVSLLALLLSMQGCFVGHGGHRGYGHHDGRHDDHHHD